MKKGRLVFAALLLAATSTFLVSGTLPVTGAGTGASMGQDGHGRAVLVVRTYGKADM